MSGQRIKGHEPDGGIPDSDAALAEVSKTSAATCWNDAVNPQTMVRALSVAMVVGSILNLINHFELLWGEPLTSKALIQVWWRQ
jgi:hypothetical protein